MKIKLLFAWILLITCYGKVYPCKCGPVGIHKEVDTAFDIIVGKVVDERADTLTCNYLVDYSYDVEFEFSYKGQLTGLTTIFGGKGRGTCGAIFEKGKEYLIVVRKCERGLYTFLCSDNQLTSDAKTQIEFLNRHFKKDLKLLKVKFLLPVTILSLIVLAAIGLVTFNFYKRRLGIKN